MMADTSPQGGSAVDGWLPIESAPRDRHFLAWAVLVLDEFDEDDNIIAKDKIEQYAVVAYYAFETIVEYPWRGAIPSNLTFTHWQPLPRPPTSTRSVAEPPSGDGVNYTGCKWRGEVQ